MKEMRRNLMVGIFVLGGLVALATLVVLFGENPTWLQSTNSYALHVRFRDAAGLREGNQVTLKGIVIGRVEHIELVDPRNPGTDVDVLVSINRRYTLPVDSRAEATEPVLGQGRPPVEILPGPASNPPLTANATIHGEVRGAVEKIFPPSMLSKLEKTGAQIGETAAAMTPVLQDMHEIMQKRSPSEVDRPGGPQGNLVSAMARMDTLIKNTNDVFGDPQVKSNVREGVENLKAMSEEGKAAMTDFRNVAGDAKKIAEDGHAFVNEGRATLKKLDGNLDTISRSTIDGLDKISKFMDTSNGIASGISKGEGTVGRLLVDHRLYDELLLSIERLGDTFTEFRELVKEWRQGKIRVAL